MDEQTGLGSSPLFSDVGGIRHFGNGLHMLQQWSNVCFVETGEGIVLFDAGFEFSGDRIIQEIRAVSDRPVRYIIYGHGHADHAFGAGAVIEDARRRGEDPPVVLAQENLPKRFDRYQEMLPYQEHINRIQFGIPEGIPAFSRDYIYPDRTYRDSFDFSLGEYEFQLRHAMGETDDATWMWIPALRTAMVSDLWVWSCPNIGNPFKVQRYEVEWAQALEEIASRSPELMLPGHGPALKGREEIREACLTVARALRFLHEEVVSMLNQGKWPAQILNDFSWPEEFDQSPYLAPVYGNPYFIVQGILRRYHGWFDGNASHLFPSREGEIAREIVGVMDDPERLLKRATELSEAQRIQPALHLIDFLIDAGTSLRPRALALKSALLKRLADREPSLIARNIFLGAARRIDGELEQGL